MSFYTKITIDKDGLEQDAMRILRLLCEKGAVLAVAADMNKAVVVRDGATVKVREPRLSNATLRRRWR